LFPHNLIALFFLIPFIGNGQLLEQKIEAAENKLSLIRNQEKEILAEIEGYTFQQIQSDLRKSGLPAIASNDEVIYHSAYALAYDEKHEQAKWVAHIILPLVKNGNEGRTNDFRPDELIKTGSAVESDYFLKILLPDSTYKYDGFGYDRGHLAPSADFRYSKKALSESYYYSNMSPQTAELNRGTWANMEDALRQYAVVNNTPLFVTTGGVLHDGLKRIERGTNKVSIPEYYYKVVADVTNNKGIAFIMPNQACGSLIAQYACSIDSVETLTGLDFFVGLDDIAESKIENTSDVASWITGVEKGDVLPLSPEKLPRNSFNTSRAPFYSGKNETVNICGTVVGTKRSAKGNIFLNLDRQFPNQVFTISIFKDNVINFSYQPEKFLDGKVICVRGKISDFNGIPGIVIENEKSIKILDEQQ
jgi:endonuclease G, mitochondrial